MPETVLERVLALAGVLVCGTLIALLVPAWQDYRSKESAPRTNGATSTPPATSAASATGPRSAAAAAEGAPAKETVEQATRTPTPRVQRVTLAPRIVLTAAPGGCWLLVRENSALGPRLYEGTLLAGDRLAFKKRRLWMRIGAAEKLVMTLDGTMVRDLPVGVAEVVVTHAGIRQV